MKDINMAVLGIGTAQALFFSPFFSLFFFFLKMVYSNINKYRHWATNLVDQAGIILT
jgi:hypothetical protein